jgi:predicted RNA-binding Zn-ribbon protein involved in translation (DUF1610 family)
MDKMIAPCGINCSVCIAHLRPKKTCPGCNSSDQASKPFHCTTCRIKYCEKLPGPDNAYCSQCAEYPCIRMRNLDRRYVSKYSVSPIANLERVRSVGIGAFIEEENTKWICPDCGEKLSMHRSACLSCGYIYRQRGITS